MTSNDYQATNAVGGDVYEIAPTTVQDGFGLNVDLTFTVGTGLSRVPSSVAILGYFNNDPGPPEIVHIWAYNYMSSSWAQLSDSGSGMQDASANQNFQYSLTINHIRTADGEVKIRFTSTSVDTGDNLLLDHVTVGSVAVEAAGLTAEAIADATARHDVSKHTDHDSLGFRVSQSVIETYEVTTANTALSFTCSGLPATANYYRFHHIRVHDETNDLHTDSWILSMDDSGVVTLGRALAFVPGTDSVMYIMDGLISVAEIQSGLATSAALSTHDGKLDTAQSDLDKLTGSDGATLASAQGNYAPATSAALSTHDGKLDTAQAGITFNKNVLEGNHKITPAAGTYTIKNKTSDATLVSKTIKDKNGDAIDSINTVIAETAEPA